MTFRSTLAGLALAAVVVSHAQTVLYSTGFEESGTLWLPDTVVVGQDGWESSPFNPPMLVSNVRAKSGSQSALLTLSEVGPGSHFFFRPVAYNALATDIVIGRTSFFVDNPVGAFELFFEGTSGNIFSRFGGLLVNQQREVFWLNDDVYTRSGSLTWNQWHDVEIHFDFSTRMSTVFLNGNPLGTGAFEEPANMQFHDLALGFQTESLALSGSIFFDDYSVSVQSAAHAEPIPEPFTMTLGAAALGLAAARKRRRKA